MIGQRSVRLSKKGQLVLPKAIRDALGVSEGDELLVSLEGRTVVLTRPQFYAKATRGLLKGTWGRTKQEIEKYLQRERDSWE